MDHAGCTLILAKSEIADLKRLNVPLDTYYFCQYYKIRFKCLFKLIRQQSKIVPMYLNNKIVVPAHQTGHDNGPFWPYSTTNHKNESANLLIRAIATIVWSFITVDCCLASPYEGFG